MREGRSGLGSIGKHSLDTTGNASAAKHRRLMKHFSQVVARESERSEDQ